MLATARSPHERGTDITQHSGDDTSSGPGPGLSPDDQWDQDPARVIPTDTRDAILKDAARWSGIGELFAISIPVPAALSLVVSREVGLGLSVGHTALLLVLALWLLAVVRRRITAFDTTFAARLVQPVRRGFARRHPATALIFTGWTVLVGTAVTMPALILVADEVALAVAVLGLVVILIIDSVTAGIDLRPRSLRDLFDLLSRTPVTIPLVVVVAFLVGTARAWRAARRGEASMARAIVPAAAMVLFIGGTTAGIVAMVNDPPEPDRSSQSSPDPKVIVSTPEPSDLEIDLPEIEVPEINIPDFGDPSSAPSG